jgi:SAM-dependent methyltransferase
MAVARRVWPPRDRPDEGASPAWDDHTYERLYEAHARALPPAAAAGDGDFDRIGRIELAALVDAGLAHGHRLVDFGCGTGRLAVHAVPWLAGGSYVGIDISQTMLGHAEAAVRTSCPGAPCRVSWQHQSAPVFALADATVDLFAAFSVFTHMEHEDAYAYLRDARRVVRPHGRFVLSCLTMDLEAGRRVFRQSAGVSLRERWGTIRNVTTTYDYVEAVAGLSGWRVVKWHKGEEPSILPIEPGGGPVSLGQSVCVLEAD